MVCNKIDSIDDHLSRLEQIRVLAIFINVFFLTFLYDVG